MKMPIFLRRPSTWLAFYLLALAGCLLVYANNFGHSNPVSLSGASSSTAKDGRVSVSLQGRGLDGLTGYLSLDASNRRAIVGQIPLAGYVVDVEVVRDRAYIISQTDGVRVYDLSAPGQPEMIRKLSANGRGWRSNSDESGLYLSSLSSGVIYNPLVAGRDSHLFMGSGVETIHRGQYFYTAGGKAGLRIFSYTKGHRGSGESRELGHLDLPGFTNSLAFFGPFLVAASRGGSLSLVDISDVNNPRLLQAITALQTYEQVWVIGDILYAASQDHQLDLFRLKDRLLVRVGSTPLIGRVRGHVLAGERLYIAESGFGVSLLDISDPVHPKRIGFVGTPGEPSGLALYGDLLYVASSSSGVQIVDTKLMTPFNVAASIDTPGIASDIVLDRQWIYVASGSDGLQVVDRSDRSNLRLAANLPTEEMARALVKSGDILFVALVRGGLIGVDVSDPLMPRVVGQLKVDLGFTDLAVRGASLFACSLGGKLLKIDISDPGHMSVAESVNLPGRPMRMALAGDDVFVVAEKAGLQVVRFEPGHPGRVVGSLTRPWPMLEFNRSQGIVIDGHYAYLLQGGEGVQVVDIRNPELPKEIGFVALPERGFSIALADEYIVVSTRFNSYSFLDIRQPDKPYLVAKVNLPHSSGEFVVEGDMLYATGSTNGINVVPVPVRNSGGDGSVENSLIFKGPSLRGWYDLSLGDGESFVTAPAILRVD